MGVGDDVDPRRRCVLLGRKNGDVFPAVSAEPAQAVEICQIALRQFFNTELIVTALLAVGLALVADGLLVLAQRALTPWTRVRAGS